MRKPMSKLLAIVIVLLVATTALAANVQKHLLWERAYGEIFWSDKDAFLFVTRTREGWSGSVVQYAWEVARNFFWLPRRPTDRLSWMEVTHLSSTTSSLTVAPNTNASPLGVVGGRIYANYQDTKSKWLSDKFVAVSDDEWDAAARAFKGGSFRDIDGWSREMNLINREPGSTMLLLTVEGRPITVSIVQDENRKTILAELPSKEKLTLLDVNTTRSDVDATAYQRAFLQSR
jgi:hypothetical protein